MESLSTEEIAACLQSSVKNAQEGSENRIKSILTRTRRQTGVRDLTTFAVANFWSCLLPLIASVVALFMPTILASQSKFQNQN